jgi:hypothetical protein
MGKQAVKVVIRSRPTANFASKNIKADPVAGVILFISLMPINRLFQLILIRKMKELSIINLIPGSLSLIDSSKTQRKILLLNLF